jgi:hypothetical protein
MRKSIVALGAILAVCAIAGDSFAQTDPNPAMNKPDKQAWDLFLAVSENAATAGNNNALFETWANDGDTFKTNPAWPSNAAPTPKEAPRALSLVVAALRRPFAPLVVPIQGNVLVGEETRRNRAAFDFIVSNNLYKVSGLKTAFASAAGAKPIPETFPISFPIEAIEVKANWVDVDNLNKYNGFTGSSADAAKEYHVNTAAGKSYALVSMHVISKLVPNWTWATWEHKDNPGRCDIIGCKDSFGAKAPYVPPLASAESKTHYPDCVKSPALEALFVKAHIDPAFLNYCLKGSQPDFIDQSGLAIRLGNSQTENGFVNQSSCMTCHSRASFDATGHPTSFAGFEMLSPNDTSNIGTASVGPINPSWYWSPVGGPPSSPMLADQLIAVQRVSLPADFIWSIPFCAIDDTAQPPETRSRFCSGK